MKGYEILERVKLICDEKEKRFQELAHKGLGDSVSPEVRYLHRIIWRLFFDFQLDLMKADASAEKAIIQAVTDPENQPSQFGTQLVDPMEAAIDAGYIKDVRDKPEKGQFYVPRFFFYPQDISEAKEGDIWHDLDGRPHFCLGDGWIEARGFKPEVAEGQRVVVAGHDKADNKHLVSKLLWELRFGIDKFKFIL